MINYKKYYYKAFGINIESELPFKELEEGQANPQVKICFARVPGTLESPLSKGVRFEAKKGLFLLKIDDVANYLVKDGQEILIEKNNPSVAENEIRLFLLGPVMGALLFQRGLLPIHGSAIKKSGKAIIFSGIPGAGKSTLATAYLNRGDSIISDDISVININANNVPMIYPGFPQMKLWADTLQQFGSEQQTRRVLREGIQKFGIPVKNGYFNQPLPVQKIYILGTCNQPDFIFNTLKGIDKFNALKNNTYRWQFIKGLGKAEEHFSLVSRLAEHVDVARITRPIDSFRVKELMELINNDLKHLQKA